MASSNKQQEQAISNKQQATSNNASNKQQATSNKQH
jgi:hypothetical protein